MLVLQLDLKAFLASYTMKTPPNRLPASRLFGRTEQAAQSRPGLVLASRSRDSGSTARLSDTKTMRLFVTPSTPSQAHYLYFIKDSLAALLCIALAMKNWLVEVCAQIKYCQSEGEINPLGHCGNVYHS